jgi:hypothetical protein
MLTFSSPYLLCLAFSLYNVTLHPRVLGWLGSYRRRRRRLACASRALWLASKVENTLASVSVDCLCFAYRAYWAASQLSFLDSYYLSLIWRVLWRALWHAECLFNYLFKC